MAPLKPIILYGVNNKVKLMKFKSNLEVFVGFISLFAWAFGYCAPLFTILFTQFIRVKYVISYFT